MTRLNTADRKEPPTKDFVESKNRAYSVEDKAHARDAEAHSRQATDAGRMSKAKEH